MDKQEAIEVVHELASEYYDIAAAKKSSDDDPCGYKYDSYEADMYFRYARALRTLIKMVEQ